MVKNIVIDTALLVAVVVACVLLGISKEELDVEEEETW